MVSVNTLYRRDFNLTFFLLSELCFNSLRIRKNPPCISYKSQALVSSRCGITGTGKALWMDSVQTRVFIFPWKTGKTPLNSAYSWRATLGLRESKDLFWLKNNSPTEGKFNLFSPLSIFWKDFFPLSQTFSLQVLPVTNQTQWLLEWNLLNTYHRDKAHGKKLQGVSRYSILA